jgi:hypothetical protein
VQALPLTRALGSFSNFVVNGPVSEVGTGMCSSRHVAFVAVRQHHGTSVQR